MAGQDVPIELQKIFVVINRRAFRPDLARIKMVLALGDVDNVLDAVRTSEVGHESRDVALDWDRGAFPFIAENKEEHVFKNRTGDPGSISVFMESRDRLANARTVADQILVAPKAVKRSVE